MSLRTLLRIRSLAVGGGYCKDAICAPASAFIQAVVLRNYHVVEWDLSYL